MVFWIWWLIVYQRAVYSLWYLTCIPHTRCTSFCWSCWTSPAIGFTWWGKILLLPLVFLMIYDCFPPASPRDCWTLCSSILVLIWYWLTNFIHVSVFPLTTSLKRPSNIATHCYSGTILSTHYLAIAAWALSCSTSSSTFCIISPTLSFRR